MKTIDDVMEQAVRWAQVWCRPSDGPEEKALLRAAVESYAATREREAVEREREACALVASPYHHVGTSSDGCPRLCAVCSERRHIRHAIRARGREVKP
jgi:hypothetical protein